MKFVELDNVQKTYGPNTVVQNFDLAVDRGEFVTFLGPSGCGKTTTLRMIAGFEIPTAGTIRIDGKDITNLKPNQRKIGMVFQAYALFPNMNVEDNVGFGLKIAGLPAEQRRARVEEMLKLIGLSGFGKRFPFEMSGGQQQRVALARALVMNPKLLLADEPSGNLDSATSKAIHDLFFEMNKRHGTTVVIVTHNTELAESMPRVITLKDGLLHSDERRPEKKPA